MQNKRKLMGKVI